MSLQEIPAGSNASSRLLNENFRYLDEKIDGVLTILSTQITNRISALQASIDSQYATLTEQLNTDIADLQRQVEEIGSNVSGIADNINPDLTRGQGVPDGFVVPNPGWIVCSCSSSADHTSKVFVNGVMVAEDYQINGDRRAGTHAVTMPIMVKTSDVITYYGLWGITYFPCKGV